MNFQTKGDHAEVAIARGDEEEEADEEVGPEDTENGSKGIKEANDDDHVLILFTFSLNLRYLFELL